MSLFLLWYVICGQQLPLPLFRFLLLLPVQWESYMSMPIFFALWDRTGLDFGMVLHGSPSFPLHTHTLCSTVHFPHLPPSPSPTHTLYPLPLPHLPLPTHHRTSVGFQWIDWWPCWQRLPATCIFVVLDWTDTPACTHTQVGGVGCPPTPPPALHPHPHTPTPFPFPHCPHHTPPPPHHLPSLHSLLPGTWIVYHLEAFQVISVFFCLYPHSLIAFCISLLCLISKHMSSQIPLGMVLTLPCIHSSCMAAALHLAVGSGSGCLLTWPVAGSWLWHACSMILFFFTNMIYSGWRRWVSVSVSIHPSLSLSRCCWCGLLPPSV